jgi:hypothetical protein
MKRRRVGAGTAAVALALGISLGACAQGNTPDEYNTLTQQNFLETCTNFYFDNTDDSLAITENTVEADIEAPDQNVCQCRYEVFTGPSGQGDGTEGGMPINEAAAETIGWTGPNFTDLNSDLKSNPEDAWNTLPEEFKTGLDDCGDGGGSTTTTTSGDATTTTTAAGSTTDETDADSTTTTTAG